MLINYGCYLVTNVGNLPREVSVCQPEIIIQSTNLVHEFTRINTNCHKWKKKGWEDWEGLEGWNFFRILLRGNLLIDNTL